MKEMKLRKEFEGKLKELPDVSVELWKDSDLMCVFYRRKEFGHFHDHEEIDLRLSQKFIKKEGLTPLEDSPYHTNRSKKSRWMQFRFRTKSDINNLTKLIESLIEEEYRHRDWGAPT